MKILSIFFLVTLLYNYHIERTVIGGHQLTLEEAERILGESCQQKESTNSTTTGGHTYKSTYLANSSVEKSDKTIALYFSFESFKAETDAIEKIKTFKVSNQRYEGFELLSDIGDESFFHSDSKNFCLIIVRKGNEIILLKVNKITSKTSVKELKKIALDIVQRV